MEMIVEEGKEVKKESTTLIMPAVSVGNVGQLAVDLLIATTRGERVGYLDDANILPCVGNDAYFPAPAGHLSLPLEAYESPDNNLCFIQQRSPVAKGRVIEFATNLADFAAANGYKHVLLLSSLDFVRCPRIDMSSGFQVHYLSTTNTDGTDHHCEQLGWKRLQEYDPDQRSWKYLSSSAQHNANTENNYPFEDDFEEEDYYPSLPFAALFSCLKARGLKVTCLLCYCSEGDNTHDAFNLAEAATEVLGLKISDDNVKWVIPFSWQTVYGPPPDMSMF